MQEKGAEESGAKGPPESNVPPGTPSPNHNWRAATPKVSRLRIPPPTKQRESAPDIPQVQVGNAEGANPYGPHAQRGNGEG